MTETKGALSQRVTEYIDECLAREHGESYLISVLQKVQEEQGYLSREAMDEVSQRMQIPAAQVSGAATFYHFFNLKPKGKYRVTVCMGTACFVRGAGKVLDRLKELLGIREGETTEDGMFSIDSARCLGACALAPVVLINERVYGNVSPGDVERMLKEHGFKAAGGK
jgi:NADH:ubiquinone oxidoreductase subunit E